MGMGIRPRTRRARLLRKQSTEAEQLLWRALQALTKPDGERLKVRRQHPVGDYVVDFAIPARKLVIEIDGGQHAVMPEADADRTKALNARGYRVIRFWNNEVLDNLDGVLLVINAELCRSPTSP